MKLHYTKILLFALPLNILAHNQRNHKSTTHHTPKIPTTRLLCECELYMPNYDKDPEMKVVMENFNKQTQQRFHEYDERMKTTRHKCKDKCDKKIQKIILKDKLEKELMDKFATLHTDIQSGELPECTCKKSMVDNMEKGCLRCAGVLGGGVMPGMGLVGGSLLGAISVLQPQAIISAQAAALAEATDLATKAGIEAVKLAINAWNKNFYYYKEFVDFTSVVSKLNFKSATALHESAMALASSKSCDFTAPGRTPVFCNTIENGEKYTFGPFAEAGTTAYDAEFATKSIELEAAKVDAVNATYGGCQTAIIASVVAIVTYSYSLNIPSFFPHN
ncbi:rifin PIR protein, putative [Plasmodium reichenowi]|uniref:Rifin PIR protein, putative n=1 Tax=Plasmodium reichenowi TaxID=5854 RepID=A0A2P9DSG0_PLARE|nr:rifin PIR protein, putative [Plasmodium reichenowi]